MSLPGDEHIPREWGPYLIDDVVSVAGPTVTYRARRITGGTRFAQRVLLKTLRSRTAATREQMQLLENEAEACSRIQSPLFARLIDTAENGEHIALIFADDNGFRLSQILAINERLDALQAMAIGIELSRALGNLHRHGFLNGNIHPDVVEIGADGALRLHGGFSAASHVNAEALTSPGLLSPEQIVGQEGDARSDVFLLGSLLYRLLTGRNAFQGPSSGIGQRVRHEKPPTPGELVRGLDRQLSQTIMRCLAKRPNERFFDMSSLACQLTRLLRQQTSVPVDHLLVASLADANLCEPLPLPKERKLRTGLGLNRAPRQVGLAVLLSSVIIAVTLFLALRTKETSDFAVSDRPQGVWRQPARLRVLAHPWAEIHIDGEHRATTPIAFPIELKPGHHKVVLKHPSAPPEARDIQIIAGQLIALDITMKVRRPKEANDNKGGEQALPSATPQDPGP